MPLFSKRTLSLYLRSGCRRQLRHALYPHNREHGPDRVAQGLPPKGPVRPGTAQAGVAGEKYQAEKVKDLIRVFPADSVHGDPKDATSGRYHSIELLDRVGTVSPGQFLIEAEYEVTDTFKRMNGVHAINDFAGRPLLWSRVRPDILQVLDHEASAYMLDVTGAVRPRPKDDRRWVLRPIDVKLAGEPSAHYFAEVVYYGMTLAAWVEEHGYADRFVVHPSPAVWPGSHDASHVAVERERAREEGRVPTAGQLRNWLEQDLEAAEPEVFAPRIKRVLRDEVPEVLAEPDWRSLPWHVGSHCIGCEYLGYAWPRATRPVLPDHCWRMAEAQDEVCRVAYLTKGAAAVLRPAVGGVRDLARRSPEEAVFSTHHGLRAIRALVPSRARALTNGITGLVEHTGVPVGMPTLVDLRIFLGVEFDVTTGFSLALASSATWAEGLGHNVLGARQSRLWRTEVRVVDKPTLETEWRELEHFLRRIQSILAEVTRDGGQQRYQIYVWDTLQFRHLTRVISRHLPRILGNPEIAWLAWLFPSEELVPHPSVGTRESPVTVLADVIRAHLAGDMPHRYGLLETAARYSRGYRPRPVNAFYHDPLSDQIPSERAQDIWLRKRHWLNTVRGVQGTTRRKLWAISGIQRRLESDLRGMLRRENAPYIGALTPPYQSRISADGQLWYAFARLNEALKKHEIHQTWGMPPHEREARFESARLTNRIQGNEEAAVLREMGLTAQAGRRVYAIHPDSREIKRKAGDFQVALSPRNAPNFLDLNVRQVLGGTPAEPTQHVYGRRMADATKVTIRAIDRERGWLVLDHRPRQGWPTLDQIERFGSWPRRDGRRDGRRQVNLSREVMLDPIHDDFFTGKLKAALHAIGNPPAAGREGAVLRALHQIHGRGARRTAANPPGDFLWDSVRMVATRTDRDTDALRLRLEAAGVRLNPSQWEAWTNALCRRLHLIWGPPGTGKSQTLRAVVLGAVLDAAAGGGRLRVLITGPTYQAIDNILDDLRQPLADLVGSQHIEAFRLRSSYRDPLVAPLPGDRRLPVTDVELAGRAETLGVRALRTRLGRRTGITIVAAPPEQVHNLLTAGDGDAVQPIFDLVLVDEASQVDVAHAVLPLCAVSGSGSVVLAGDHLQMAPIHQAQPPHGLEVLVGSIFEYYRKRYDIKADQLNRNYRSNSEIVTFSQRAGYISPITAHSAGLRLNLLDPVPVDAAPNGWPADLPWTSEWSVLLDPNTPTVAFVYPDGQNGQANEFEAGAVTTMLFLLRGRLAGVSGWERPAEEGGFHPEMDRPYNSAEFWTRGVGIVTPHRAQQGRIVDRLQRVLGDGASAAAIREAVDTVERFQGQERDLIVASFAVGDPDVVAQEEEFLFQLTRFNVMASRARAKLILLVSQEIVDHLPNDIDVLRASRLLKVYVDSHCGRARPMIIGGVRGSYRYS